MSYEKALEAAGAKIIEFREFGSYQGEWFAFVEFKGDSGWVSGGYGSCSGCDSFQAEFGWHDDCCDDHFSPESGCEECAKKSAGYAARLADFGNGYLPPMPASTLLKELDRAGKWDSESAAAAAWIRDTDALLAKANGT